MMRSMFSAISGLKNHQTFMDVVGNNIANVNTTGFKQSRVTFQDILSQTVRGASGPQGGRAGVNPMQVGLGTLISGVDTIQTQGTLQSTGKQTDMAIQGDGYFVVGDGSQDFYTRDGTFDVGIDNTLVSPSSGLHVMGWQADPVTGAVNTATPTAPITIPLGAGMTGKPSTTLDIAGNLDANNAGGALNKFDMDGTVYDSLGNPIKYTLTLTKNTATPNTWDVTVGSTDMGGTPAGPVSAITYTGGSLTFNSSGKIDAPGGLGQIAVTLTNGSAPLAVALDMSKITQLASTPSNLTSSTDGAEAGTLTMFTVGSSGEITGSYSNGFKQTLGQIALATFSNPSGLVKSGSNLFTGSANSGTPQVGLPDTGGRGKIATGFLEGSNVDLAQQFTNMIMAERGFQANSRVITTSDEILQDLVNLKH